MGILILGCVATVALATGSNGMEQTRVAAPSCCYTNPRYSGVCSVEPGEGESCGTVLAYLNDPQSQGKSYCANTTIRGGWEEKKCAPVKSESSPTTEHPVQ